MEKQEGASLERLVQAADRFKMFMLTNSTKTNLNLYDHLVRLLTKILDERPGNAVDVVEDLSREVKEGFLRVKQDTLRDLQPPSPDQLRADQLKNLFSCGTSEDEQEELVEFPLQDVAELAFFFEQAGVGLGREEMSKVFLAMKQLLDLYPLQRCRFWGKILGTRGNYFVVEGEFKEGEGEEEEETPEEEEREEEEQEEQTESEGLEPDDPPPKSAYKPPPTVPVEKHSTGTNKFTYFVCSEPGMPWTRLPLVTPAQIAVSRQIRKYFTGVPDAPIRSYPPFPGNEANYLRAQIARISAGTHVSPSSFYRFLEEEDDEMDEQHQIEENPDFEPISVNEMATSLSDWVHHVQHILTQGRCEWVNLNQKDEENEDASEEEDEEDPDVLKPECGPPLLTSLTEDAMISETPPWTSMLSSKLIPQLAVAVLRSNLWPGAYAFAREKKFGNIYIGWGLRYIGEAFTPAMPPPPQSEYPSGPEITEALDPSVEEEEAFRATQQEETASDEAENQEDEEEEEDD